MFDSTTLITFLAAGVAIIIAPGPAPALALTRALGEGRAAPIIPPLRPAGVARIPAFSNGLMTPFHTSTF